MSDEAADDLTEEAAPTIDQARYRQVMGHFATGVTIITAMHDGEPVGLTAQTFVPLSMDPPLVLFCIGRSSSSWPRIEAAGSFCVNVLSDHQEAVCRAFASSGADKYRGVGWRPAAATGAPIIHDSLAWVEGRIDQVVDGGDHFVVIGRVLDLDVADDGQPLLFYRGGFGRFEP